MEMRWIRRAVLTISMILTGGYAPVAYPAPPIAAVAAVQAAAQPQGSAAVSSSGQSEAQASGRSSPAEASIAEGTRISAVLESVADAKTAKPGDIVAARVAKDVKQEGQVVIHKGDRLIGKVISAKAKGQGNSESSLVLAFDQLTTSESTSVFHAVIQSVVTSKADFENDPGESDAPRPVVMAPPAGGRATSGGGLLGGLGATTSSAVGMADGTTSSITGEIGGTLSSTTDTPLSLGSTGGLVATPARAIRVDAQASATQSAGQNSVLRTQQENLRLESGTALEFRAAARADTSAEEGR